MAIKEKESKSMKSDIIRLQLIEDSCSLFIQFLREENVTTRAAKTEHRPRACLSKHSVGFCKTSQT